MPMDMTVSDIPDELYERLEMSAKRNHRSVSDEAIACLETATLYSVHSNSERLESIRRMTCKQDPLKNATIDIDEAKREGRA
jgi:plasmid stability protein